MILKNETIEAILTRRSIRKFSGEALSKDILETLAECGRHAPSGMGLQTWKFTIVTNAEIIREICGIVEKNWNVRDMICTVRQPLLFLPMPSPVLTDRKIMPVPLKIFFLRPVLWVWAPYGSTSFGAFARCRNCAVCLTVWEFRQTMSFTELRLLAIRRMDFQG